MLIARHESLRTTYVPGEQPRQRVAAAGVQLLEVCSLGEGQWGPRDRPAVAEALVQWLRESPDPARRPVRVAVAIAPDAGDRVIACAAAFSHLAVDHGAIEILRRDFAGLLGDPAATAGRTARPLSRWTRPSWRRRRPSGAGPTRPWTTCGSSRGGSPAACTRCRAPGPAASRWRWSCRRWPPRWPCGGWRRAPGPAGPASCSRPSAPWSPAAPATGNWCSPCCQATGSSATGELRRRPGPGPDRHRRDRRKKFRRAGPPHLDHGDGGEPARPGTTRPSGTPWPD